MPIYIPQGDLARATTHEPDQTWPDQVKLQLIWHVDGRAHVRTLHIDADEFFGRGGRGAPMDGHALVQHIENMRREGPPPVDRRPRGQRR